MAYERLDESKPIRYFITYDFETVPRIINQGYGSKSVVNGIEVHNSQQHTVLEPLSVASTIKSKSGIKKIYFDLRQKNFIEKWHEQLFEEAKQLKEDNQYDDPEIPYDISIPVIGSCWFCKARFTNENRPTLDRINNAIGHTKDNVRLA
ncbi:MAG: hypothetical protein EZS28_031743, partial [Streblomastix strix]